MKLVFDLVTFSEALLFKDPYFFQGSYRFLQELLFRKMLFMLLEYALEDAFE